MAVLRVLLLLGASASVVTASLSCTFDCCDNLEDALEVLQAEFGEVKGNVSTLDSAISGLESDVSSLENTTTTQQAALDQLEAECNCTDFEDRIHTLEMTAMNIMQMIEAIANMTSGREDIEEGTLRLAGSNVSSEGRVEVFLMGVWGTVCEDFWSSNDAIVACNQLGLPSGNAVALRGTQSPMSPFGPGVGPIWLDNLLCDGSEPRLVDCSSSGSGVGVTNCDHSEDVGVICQN